MSLNEISNENQTKIKDKLYELQKKVYEEVYHKEEEEEDA